MTVGIAPFFFDRATLNAAADANADAYRSARPFPHAALDGLVPDDVVAAVAAEFPSGEAPGWDLYTDQGNTRKWACSREESMGPVTRQVVAQFQTGPIVEFLQRLTGIEHLVSDPWLYGGGLHQSERGGFLRVHADFNYHEGLKLERRINLLLYLNPVWEDDWGGHLELWNEDMTKAEARIAPLGGRVVVFNTTSTAYHGHPDPVQCPEGVFRRSLAFFYYTNGRPAEEQREHHSTLYQTPGQAPSAPTRPEAGGGRLSRLRRRGT